MSRDAHVFRPIPNVIRVLYVSERYPPEVGGAEIQAHRVASRLGADFHMDVLTRRVVGCPPVEVMDGVRVERMPWFQHEGTVAATGNAASLLWRGIRVTRPDVIQAFQLDLTAIVAVVLAVRWQAPLILTVTGRDAVERHRGWRRRKVQALGRIASQIVAVSETTYGICLAAGLPRSKLRIIQNGVDTGYFRPPGAVERDRVRAGLGIKDADFVFVWLGRLQPIKGLDCLPPVWGKVVARRPEARLLVVGEGDDRAPVDALMKWFPESVTHLPFQRDVRPYLHAADALLMTSRSEGLSCTLLEGMAAGLPAVVSSAPENVAIGHGSDFMIVFDRESPEDVVRALVRAIDERALGRRRGEEARRLAEEHYSLAATTRAWAKLYSELAGARWQEANA